jgi:hypothetical protein
VCVPSYPAFNDLTFSSLDSIAFVHLTFERFQVARYCLASGSAFSSSGVAKYFWTFFFRLLVLPVVRCVCVRECVCVCVCIGKGQVGLVYVL